MEAPHVASPQNRPIWEQHSTGGDWVILSFGADLELHRRALRDVDIQLYAVVAGEGAVINNPTRSAMETASAKD